MRTAKNLVPATIEYRNFTITTTGKTIKAVHPSGFELKAKSVEAAMAKVDEAVGPAGLGACQWFARCDNYATGLTSHPVLGVVPTCDRCAAFAEAK